MSTIRLPELTVYRSGDLARIPCVEPDPVPGWAEQTERDAHDIRSIYAGGDIVAAFGYIPISIHEVDAFAVVDRGACLGIGAEVAKLIHDQMKRWMNQTGVCQVNAHCSAHDHAARVFLRAAGFRKERTTAETAYFTFIWR